MLDVTRFDLVAANMTPPAQQIGAGTMLRVSLISLHHEAFGDWRAKVTGDTMAIEKWAMAHMHAYTNLRGFMSTTSTWVHWPVMRIVEVASFHEGLGACVDLTARPLMLPFQFFLISNDTTAGGVLPEA